MEDMFFYNIDKYVYEECSESEMKLFMEHIKSCEKCKAEYELACQVKDAMHGMNNITPPADFSKLVNERLDRELSKPKARTFIKAGYRKYSAVAACLVLAAVLGAEKVDFTNAPVIDSSVGLQPVVETEETQKIEIPSITPEAVSGAASTTQAPTVEPAKAYVKKDTYAPVKTPDVVTPPVSAIVSDVIMPPVATEAPVVITSPVVTKAPAIPEHLNPENQTVLASSVEKTYEISGVSLEEVPVKKRNLEEEFALLETTKTGVIVANPATMSSLDGVEVKIKKSNTADYGVGSGSLFIAAKDKEIVDELITKYISVEDNSCYFFTGDNFDSFIQELDDQGVDYKEKLVSEKGNNVAIKVVVA